MALRGWGEERASPSVALIAQHLLAAALLSASLVSAGVIGMFVTSAPRLVSLLMEPLSLLLTPGLAVVIVFAGPHDFAPLAVIWTSLLFYFVAIYLALALRQHEDAVSDGHGRDG